MASGAEGLRVLVVEDERPIADFIRLGLAHQGYRVEIASDGAEGLRRFVSFDPHLVVLDLMLPRMDGLTLCRRLRETSMVPILMLTARDEVRDRVQGPPPEAIRAGTLVLDPAARAVTIERSLGGPDRARVRSAALPDAPSGPGAHPRGDPAGRLGLRLRWRQQRDRCVRPLSAR